MYACILMIQPFGILVTHYSLPRMCEYMAQMHILNHAEIQAQPVDFIVSYPGLHCEMIPLKVHMHLLVANWSIVLMYFGMS